MKASPTARFKDSEPASGSIGQVRAFEPAGGAAPVPRVLHRSSEVSVGSPPSTSAEATAPGVVQLMSGKKGGGDKKGGGGGKKGNGGKGGGKKPAISDKERRKRQEQSQADRNAFRSVQYETTDKKSAKAKQQSAAKVGKNIAHGRGSKASGRQGRTDKLLKEVRDEARESSGRRETKKEEAARKKAEAVRKKAAQAAKQKSADAAKRDWLDRQDRDDRGGAGGGFGVLVSTGKSE